MNPHRLLFSLCALLCVLPTPVLAASTELASMASDTTQADNDSSRPWVSGDGRYVAFHSLASNLVAGDTNGEYDVFVHDRTSGQTARVSVASDGTQGNGGSYLPAISADGRWIAFYSLANNLVVGDDNNDYDVFVHDRTTGQTARVSVASDGAQASDDSSRPSVSGDGRYVAFESLAANLVPADTNRCADVFMHDLVTGQTTRVSLASDGTQANADSGSPSLSQDGQHVTFHSGAANLVAGDTNGWQDVFVRDRLSGKTTRVSVASDGTQANGWCGSPSLSGDGRYVAFYSLATNLVAGDTNGSPDVFVHDRITGQTVRVSMASDGTQGNDGSFFPAISSSARYVTFYSSANNLVPGDSNNAYDVFVHDRETRVTTRLSLANDGSQSNGNSLLAAISAQGGQVAFQSEATNLVASDGNGSQDVFVRDLLAGQ